MSSRAVHHLAVVVAELARAERFYVEVLGLPVLRRWDDDHGTPRSIWLELGGGAFLAVERAAEPTGARRSELAPGHHCLALCVEVSEREPLRKALAAAGHPVVRESAYTLYVHDPDGNLVGLSHWPDASEPTT